MLKQIQIKNFKVIKDSSLLDLQPLTVLIGRNGSGKSSLIEALDWLGLAVAEGAEVATEPFQNINDVLSGWRTKKSPNLSIKLAADPQDISAGEGVVYQVEVNAAKDSGMPTIVYEELVVKNRDGDSPLIRTVGDARQRRFNVEITEKPNVTDVRERKDRELETLAPTAFEEDWVVTTNPDRLALSDMDPVRDRAGDFVKEFLERAVFLRLNPRSIASFTSPRMKYSPRLLDDEGSRLASLLGTLDEETLEILVEKLAFIIKGANSLESHRPSGPADRRYFTFVESLGSRKAPLKVPAWLLSEGTRRVTAILAVLLHDKPPPLLCIEEIENGLDPWTIKYVLDELTGAVERGTQVIITTHSPYLLNLFPPDNILFCDRTPQGVTFTPVNQLPDLEVIQTRMGVGDLYANRYFHSKRVEMGDAE
jgi:predicted ATPase